MAVLAKNIDAAFTEALYQGYGIEIGLDFDVGKALLQDTFNECSRNIVSLCSEQHSFDLNSFTVYARNVSSLQSMLNRVEIHQAMGQTVIRMGERVFTADEFVKGESNKGLRALQQQLYAIAGENQIYEGCIEDESGLVRSLLQPYMFNFRVIPS